MTARTKPPVPGHLPCASCARTVSPIERVWDIVVGIREECDHALTTHVMHAAKMTGP